MPDEARQWRRNGTTPLRPNHLIFRVLFTPCRRAAVTTSDDSALPKAISRQHRGRRAGWNRSTATATGACPGKTGYRFSEKDMRQLKEARAVDLKLHISFGASLSSNPNPHES
jgi:hypothetical protein